MKMSPLSLVAAAVLAGSITGCRTTPGDPNETSTGLPYHPPPGMTYVDTPPGFSAPPPGEPLTQRRYLPPTPEIPSPKRRLLTTPLTNPAIPEIGNSSPTKHVPTAEVGVPQNEWVQAAAEWKGVPYRLGGTTKQGIDCSGLVQQLYREVRHQELPRTTSELFAKTISTGVSEVQPGDLLFFTNGMGDKSSHVGLVIGNRVFVHSSTTLGVTYGSLDDKYWSKRFTGSRRYDP